MNNLLLLIVAIIVLSAGAGAQSFLTIDAGASIVGEAGTDICANDRLVSGTLSGSGTWCSSGYLPVELASFQATAQRQEIILRWSTATERNVYGFQVERRTVSSRTWDVVGFLAGAGTSTTLREYSYADRSITPGRYVYRLMMIDRDGSFTYSASVEIAAGLPSSLTLHPGFPNPFNPTTVIRYELPEAGVVRLEIFNVLGERVEELVSGPAAAGYHEVTWRARVSSGVYVCRMEVSDIGGRGEHFVDVKKLMLLK